MLNVLQIKKNRTHRADPPVVGGLLARAPKTVAVATVLLADLLVSSGLFTSKPQLPAGALSCERASCQRQALAKPAVADSVDTPMGQPRLLEFTSKHCASCGKMAPLVSKLERDCTEHDGTILPVDVDTDTGDLLATRYGVNALPTFIMIDANGAEVNRLVGEQPRQRLVVALADVNGVFCPVL